MATTHLGIAVPVEAQANKTLTIADALDALDKATQGATPLVITGATTVTAACGEGANIVLPSRSESASIPLLLRVKITVRN